MTTAEKTKTIVPPFGIEFDHPRNADFVLQAIPGSRFRSKIKSTVTNIDGSVRSLVDKPTGAMVPEVPGMQIHVNPEKLEFAVVDPLNDDQEALEAVKAYINKVSLGEIDGIKGVPTTKEKLDVHRMKTLCRELIQILEEGHAKVVKGPTPQLDDVKELPGHFLLNPGMREFTTQPTYEKDWARWVDALTKAGA
jgi:hypothetical protein